jgi:tryptophanyl-tRNA synthetase
MADDADTIRTKIRKARTDPDALPGTAEGLAGRPEATNLIGIYAALAGISVADTLARFEGAMFSGFKAELADLAVSVLAPIGENMKRIAEDPGYVDGILHRGAERANEVAKAHLGEIHDIIGLLDA